MNLKIVRRIRDNVHGSIDVTEIEDRVIAHPFLQRLRRVKQLAFLSYVFPGASHTRFEHSLGVMHLAGVAWEKLKVNQQRLGESIQQFSQFRERELKPFAGQPVLGLLAPTIDRVPPVFADPDVLQTLRLAALLHDVGHPPFSHSGERFLPTWSECLAAHQTAAPYLKDYLERKAKDPKRAKQSVRHEVYSMLMIDMILQEIGSPIPAQDVVSLINQDIPPSPHGPIAKYDVQALCHELISAELDIDRMDYLLRDSRECGVVYGIFDAGRILDSLCVYEDAQTHVLHLAITLSGLAAFEDYLRARLSMYLQLYFHKTSVAAEAMLQHCARVLSEWRFPCDVHAYADIDEYNIGQMLLRHAQNKLVQGDYQQFANDLRDLLFHRNLWKRVYEISENDSAKPPEQFERVIAMLRQQGIRAEGIASSNSLTRFRPVSESGVSSNPFRLVKKDDRQFPRIVPIEQFSETMKQSRSTSLYRVYVPIDDVTADGQNSFQVARQMVLTMFDTMG